MGNFWERNNSHPTTPPPTPPLKVGFFKYFLLVAQTAARHCIEGGEGRASFISPLKSAKYIWIDFVADWRINITVKQPKTFLHPKKTRPISELKHTFRTTPRSGQYLTHAHIYITRTVTEKACTSLTDGKREIQSEPAKKLELILAISINYWT